MSRTSCFDVTDVILWCHRLNSLTSGTCCFDVTDLMLWCLGLNTLMSWVDFGCSRTYTILIAISCSKVEVATERDSFIAAKWILSVQICLTFCSWKRQFVALTLQLWQRPPCNDTEWFPQLWRSVKLIVALSLFIDCCVLGRVFSSYCQYEGTVQSWYCACKHYYRLLPFF